MSLLEQALVKEYLKRVVATKTATERVIPTPPVTGRLTRS